MRYVAAYLLAALGGNEHPSAKDIKKILTRYIINKDYSCKVLLNFLKIIGLVQSSPVASKSFLRCRYESVAFTMAGPYSFSIAYTLYSRTYYGVQIKN